MVRVSPVSEWDEQSLGSSERPRHYWRTGTFNPTLWPLGRGKGLEVELITKGQWFDQSCLWNGTSMKSLNDEVARTSGWVNTLRCWEGGVLGEDVQVCAPPACLALRSSFIQCFPELYELLEQIIKPEKGSRSLLTHSQLVISTGSNWDLQLASDMGTVLSDWAINLWGLKWLQEVSVRIAVNCRPPPVGIWRIKRTGYWCVKNPHTRNEKEEVSAGRKEHQRSWCPEKVRFKP